MANEVILTQGDLVINNFYKVMAYNSNEVAVVQAIPLGAFVRFQSTGNLKLVADPDGNLYPNGSEVEAPDKYFYKLIPSNLISDYQTAKQALVNY